MSGTVDQTLLVDGYYDTIVIGSGIGGMTAAAFLAKCNNERVLVLEQHPTTCGGCTHEFERKNVEFDTGIHYIGGDMWNPNSTMRRVFDFVTDGKVQWLKMEDAFDFTTVDGVRYEIRSGLDRQRDYLKQRFPQQPVDVYFNDVEKTANRYTKFLLAMIADAYLPKFFVERAIQDTSFGEETVNQALDRLKITDATLRKVLTYNYGDYGFEPSQSSYVQHCMTVVHYANGASYPVNGPHVIADSVAGVIERVGGKMMCNAKVHSIIIENGEAKGVIVKNFPRPLTAKRVISACGAYNTFVDLINEKGLTEPEEAPVKRAKEAFMNGTLKLSPSFAMVFSVFEGRAGELQIPAGNLWVQDSKNFPYVFLSFPSVRDASWEERHPNETVCEIIVEARYSEFVGISEDEYRNRKSEIAHKMLEEAYRQYPRLEGKFKFMVSSTPRTSAKFLGTQEGCSYGVAPNPARYRANRDWMKPQTPVKKLFLAGQDVVSCGMCGGMFGGMLAAGAASSKCLMKARELILPVRAAKL